MAGAGGDVRRHPAAGHEGIQRAAAAPGRQRRPHLAGLSPPHLPDPAPTAGPPRAAGICLPRPTWATAGWRRSAAAFRRPQRHARRHSQRDREGNVYFAYRQRQPRLAAARTLAPRNLQRRRQPVQQRRQAGAMRACRTAKVPRRAGRWSIPRKRSKWPASAITRSRPGGKTYRIYRGDLHRHTDISQDGVGDGSLMDLHRYGLDAAALDYIMVSDHNMGNDNEYCWWRTQKANDLYTVPGAFISMYGYERSVPYPNGHRNVIWPERGHRTLPLPAPPFPAQMATDTGKLYAYLRETGGICTLHTSATGQGTNWEQHDRPRWSRSSSSSRASTPPTRRPEPRGSSMPVPT